MNEIARDISVDSGTILISDKSFYEKWNGKVLDKNNELFKKFELENGQYQIEWEIDETWNGNVSGDGYINIDSGIVIISDPCYHFKNHDDWMKLLNSTDYLASMPEGVMILDSMGGDGTYNVHINFRKM